VHDAAKPAYSLDVMRHAFSAKPTAATFGLLLFEQAIGAASLTEPFKTVRVDQPLSFSPNPFLQCSDTVG